MYFSTHSEQHWVLSFRCRTIIAPYFLAASYYLALRPMASKHSFALSWDTFGIGVSTVCMIHCLAVPVLFSILPLSSVLPGLHGWVHPIFMATLLPVIYFAAKKSHYDRLITGLLVGGFLMLAAGWIGGHEWFGHEFETVTTIVGSVVLVAGHWRNYRHHQTCRNPHHHHHDHHHAHAHDHTHTHHHSHNHHHTDGFPEGEEHSHQPEETKRGETSNEPAAL